MPQAEFKPAIPASERPQTHVFDRAATGIGSTPEVFGGKTCPSGNLCTTNPHMDWQTGKGLRWCYLCGEIPLSVYGMTPVRFGLPTEYTLRALPLYGPARIKHHNHGTSGLHSFTRSLVIKVKESLYRPGQALRFSKRLSSPHFKTIGI